MAEQRAHLPWVIRVGSGLTAVFLVLNALLSVRPAAAQQVATPTSTPASTVAAPIGPFYFPVIFNNAAPGQSTVLIRQQQGFDACNLPALSTMATWWKSSPYSTVNIYLGGSSFPVKYCSFGVTNSYLAAADQQGWTFILTWVGPQAPCYAAHYPNDLTSISYNTTTAYNQGRSEADAAVTRARNLGFTGGLAIYYDMEAYAYYETTSCRTAANTFMSGWVSRLHELNVKAGGYGSTCSSRVSDWWTIANRPDYLWAAFWNSTSAYSQYASVYGLWCLSDSYWSNHQRIRQYAGDHTETWGSRSLEIDSNVIDGAVQAYSYGGLVGTSGAASSAPLTAQAVAPALSGEQLVGSGSGWVISGSRLLWTDTGAAWREITPLALAGGLLSADFLDAQHGWAVGTTSSGQLSAAHTADGGASWEVSTLDASGPVTSASIEFAGPLNGWISARLPSSAAFSRGALYRTADGGATWRALPLPAAGKVVFTDALHGWVSGGASGGELYATTDGGQTWQPVQLPGASRQEMLGLPAAASTGLLLPVAALGDAGLVVKIYESKDGGITWTQASTAALPGAELPAEAPQLVESGPGRWSLAMPDGSLVSVNSDGQIEIARSGAALPTGTAAYQIAASGEAWARTWNGACSGDKTSAQFTCSQRSQLFRSTDSGRTWSDITPG